MRFKSCIKIKENSVDLNNGLNSKLCGRFISISSFLVIRKQRAQ